MRRIATVLVAGLLLAGCGWTAGKPGTGRGGVGDAGAHPAAQPVRRPAGRAEH